MKRRLRRSHPRRRLNRRLLKKSRPRSRKRLNQLRQRWERDPKSRAFLQLAEEYRRAGRLSDALHVLRAGLEEHPTYLAAQVALGRCLVETDAPDAAIGILERAVARDPAQLVANKLLVEAYLAKRQAGKARERLELYKLFNDHDAEIESLEARRDRWDASYIVFQGFDGTTMEAMAPVVAKLRGT